MSGFSAVEKLVNFVLGLVGWQLGSGWESTFGGVTTAVAVVAFVVVGVLAVGFVMIPAIAFGLAWIDDTSYRFERNVKSWVKNKLDGFRRDLVSWHEREAFKGMDIPARIIFKLNYLHVKDTVTPVSIAQLVESAECLERERDRALESCARLEIERENTLASCASLERERDMAIDSRASLERERNRIFASRASFERAITSVVSSYLFCSPTETDLGIGLGADVIRLFINEYPDKPERIIHDYTSDSLLKPMRKIVSAHVNGTHVPNVWYEAMKNHLMRSRRVSWLVVFTFVSHPTCGCDFFVGLIFVVLYIERRCDNTY